MSVFGKIATGSAAVTSLAILIRMDDRRPTNAP